MPTEEHHRIARLAYEAYCREYMGVGATIPYDDLLERWQRPWIAAAMAVVEDQHRLAEDEAAELEEVRTSMRYVDVGEDSDA